MLANLQATHPDEIVANASKQRVLAYLETDWNLYNASLSAGVRRFQLDFWLRDDQEFAKAFQELKDKHLDGCESNLFKQGKDSKKSFVPAIFLLKSHRPEVYGDKAVIDLNQNVKLDFSRSANNSLEVLGLTPVRQLEPPTCPPESPDEVEEPPITGDSEDLE